MEQKCINNYVKRHLNRTTKSIVSSIDEQSDLAVNDNEVYLVTNTTSRPGKWHACTIDKDTGKRSNKSGDIPNNIV